MLASAKRLDDGFSTTISLSNIPTIKLFEKDVTPPGMTAGGAIDTTTMRNLAWRTMAPRKLKTLTPVSATVAYATEALETIFAQIGIIQLVTITFPDESTLAFWGWLEEFTPGTNTEGEQPTANMVVQTGNRNADGEEVAPLYTPPAGSSGEE